MVDVCTAPDSKFQVHLLISVHNGAGRIPTSREKHSVVQITNNTELKGSPRVAQQKHLYSTQHFVAGPVTLGKLASRSQLAASAK